MTTRRVLFKDLRTVLNVNIFLSLTIQNNPAQITEDLQCMNEHNSFQATTRYNYLKLVHLNSLLLRPAKSLQYIGLHGMVFRVVFKTRYTTIDLINNLHILQLYLTPYRFNINIIYT